MKPGSRAFKRCVLGLSGACLFAVTYMLVLPASAFNKDSGYSCGLPAHTHGPLCYERVLACSEGHAHSGECYEDILVCDYEEHVHGDGCVK